MARGKLYKSHNFRLIIGLVLVIVITFVIAYFIGQAVGFKKNKNAENVKYEFDINKILPEEIKKNLREVTKKAHMAGTESEEVELVNLIKERWNSQLDHVDVHTYNVLLSYPNESNPNYVAMIDVDGKEYDKTPFKEPPVTESENFDDVGNYFNAYGAAGRVQGQLVYVNYASQEDFVFLSSRSMTTNGKICIARYGKLYRGDKTALAEKSGCIGLILFSDPKNFGDPVDYSLGYPHSFWLPETGIQRGSVLEGEGDPLTPIYPSLEYMYRTPESKAELPKIPVQPIGFLDAYKYMSKLGGDDVPKEWQGGFNITYKFGGVFKVGFENNEIVLFSDNYRPRKNIRNVVGYIWGKEEPDRYVIIGNHRDAWVYGAVDPSSGTAVMLEVARALGESVKDDKWRPKRTIVFCSWGAEEYGLIGSYEWVETYKKTLMLNTVVYINIDTAASGNITFDALASPNLIKVIREATKEIPNPNKDEIMEGRKSVYDTWLFRNPDKDDPKQPATRPMNSAGSDFTAFVQLLGVSCLDLGYWGHGNVSNLSYRVYHSAHDTLEHYETFIDPQYKVSAAIGQICAVLALRFANDAVLPFDCELYGKAIKKIADGIVAQYKSQLDNNGISYEGFLASIERFQSSCATFTTNSVNPTDEDNKLMTRRLNDKLMMLERGFIDDNGLPGRLRYKHVAFAPSRTNAYGGVGFPGIVDTIYDAMNDGNWTPVQEQFGIVQFFVESATNVFSLGMPLAE